MTEPCFDLLRHKILYFLFESIERMANSDYKTNDRRTLFTFFKCVCVCSGKKPEFVFVFDFMWYNCLLDVCNWCDDKKQRMRLRLTHKHTETKTQCSMRRTSTECWSHKITNDKWKNMRKWLSAVVTWSTNIGTFPICFYNFSVLYRHRQ